MEITGYIVNEKNQQLTGATFSWVNLSDGSVVLPPVVTDGTYRVIIDLPQVDKNDYLKISMPGYETTFFPVLEYLASPASLIVRKKFPFLLLAAGVGVAYALSDGKQVGAIDSDKVKTGLYITGGVVGFVLLKQLLETLGIWKSAATVNLDNASTNPNSFWNPHFWETKPAGINYTNPISLETARAYADSIYNSMTWYDDNEDRIISLFKTLPSQAAASFVSAAFAAYQHKDLLTFLRGGMWPNDALSDSDVNEINNFVNRLPKY